MSELRNDARLERLAHDLAMTLYMVSHTRPTSELSAVTGLPVGVVSGLCEQGRKWLEDVL